MKQFLMLCALALFAVGDCGMMEEDPWVKVTANLMADGIFEVDGSWMQGFPMGDEPTKATHEWSVKNLGTTELGEVKTYFVWNGMDGCLTWSPTEAKKEDFYELVVPKAPEMNATDILTEELTQGDMMEDKSDMEAEEYNYSVFDLIQTRIVIMHNGINYCVDPKVEESQGMNMVVIKFTKGIEMNRYTLKYILSQKLDLDEKYILIGNMEMGEECSSAQVFINKKLDDKDMLRKAFLTFKSMSDLGVYSTNEKCMTDIKDSFIVKNILMMLAEGKPEKEDEEAPTTCAGVSSRLAAEYKARLEKYDCMVAHYNKKYGMSMEGCKSSGGKSGHDKSDGMWGSKDGDKSEMSKCNCATTTQGVDAEFEKNFVQLMQALGAMLENPEIATLKAELQNAIKAQSPDPEKITNLVKKIKQKKEGMEKYLGKAAYGMCMVAGYGDMALDKFQEVKGKIEKGQDADMILKSLLNESLMWLMEMKKSSSEEEMMDSPEMKEAMMTKLKMIFQMSGDCSKESDRKRVWMMLSQINSTVPEHLSSMAEKIGIPEISQALNGIKMVVMENPKEVATKIFLHIYASTELEEDDALMMSVKALFMAMKNNKDVLAVKAKECLKNADVETLMVVHILMLPNDLLKKGCDLKDLNDKVMAHMEDMKPSTPCSKSSSDMSDKYDGARTQQGMDDYEWDEDMWRMPPRQRRRGQRMQWREYDDRY